MSTKEKIELTLLKSWYLIFPGDIGSATIELSEPDLNGFYKFKVSGYVEDILCVIEGITSEEACEKFSKGYLPWYSEKGEIS